MSIRKAIEALNIRREEIKADLFDALAEQAEQIRKWNVEGISTPLEDRLELQAEIADLEAERQATKVELMKLKQCLKEVREMTYRQIVEDVLTFSPEILDEINIRYQEQLGGE